MKRHRFIQRLQQGIVLAALAPELILGPLSASAGETANYDLPLDADMADLVAYLETVHTMALQ